MNELIEGRDYVIENGNLVFTAYYLRERGHCCGNGCRNCPYSFDNDKKVISLVPSWTDTLVRCGVTVIGRTRFCVHPAGQVECIPKVGETKRCDFRRINELHPDIVVLDEEENARGMREAIEAPTVATNVKDIPSMISGMVAINRQVRSRNLNQLIKATVALRPLAPGSLPIERLPGVMQWIKKPARGVRTIVYLIWKDPWMAVSRQTFIGSILAYFGYGRMLPRFDEAYPVVDPGDFDRETTLFLFSSEPYPFAKKVGLIRELGLNAAIVDGEHYGWFGMKSIEFLATTRQGLSIGLTPVVGTGTNT